MKTLINKNKIRLAGGLLVLLMTAILAIATAKSYACFHLPNMTIGVMCNTLTCCTSCQQTCPWCSDGGPAPGNPCLQGPDSRGYGFANCDWFSKPTAVQCGYTSWTGSCPSPFGGCVGCVNVIQQNFPTTVNVDRGDAMLHGGLTCIPEN